MTDLTLYVDENWASPYAFSNFVALKEKGLSFEVVDVALSKKETFHGDYKVRSLTGRVPMLRHGDYFLTESTAINEYIAETFPFPKHARIFPEDLKERGRARQLMAWFRSDLMPIREERSTTGLFFPGEEVKPLSKAAQAQVDRLMFAADALISEERTTLFAQWCITDADFALMLNRLVKHGYQAAPKVMRYVQANWSRPSVREWVEHKRGAYIPH